VVLTQTFIASQIDCINDGWLSLTEGWTVQNALAAGTPIVGVAMQWEQEFNLDQAVKNGAAIRIRSHGLY
jgi:hypothetical protein